MARVLHIEDDPNNLRLVRKLLAAAGHDVVDAQSGLEGVRLADSAEPDLVLVDINVPDLDGYEVILRLRSMPTMTGVPIVAITAEGDRETSLAVGADGFIGKPINARRFAETIEQFLEGHRESGDEATGEIRLREQSHKIVSRLEDKVRALSQANADLQEMARLRREFLQNVSHELATPMTPVVGYLKLLLEEELGALTPLQRKCLTSIDRSTRRLRHVVDTLLDVSALETGKMHFYERDYDFCAVVNKAISTVRVDSEDRVTFVCEPFPEALPARGDPDKLRRAVVHVLDNAAKFTPRGAEVAIAVRQGNPARPWYELVVVDGGPGIDQSQRDSIFEPFYQIDGSATRRHGGVGLGLAFARRVSEALGGYVRISSPPEQKLAGLDLQGTEVRLRVASRPSDRQ